jgi:predicted RNase H-like HicB family nuclease
MKVRVVIVPEEDGGYSAFVPGFPGCTSCGNTREEALANIREAFEGVFEVLQNRDFGGDDYEPHPLPETIEV